MLAPGPSWVVSASGFSGNPVLPALAAVQPGPHSMSVLPACMSVYSLHAWCPWRPEEGIMPCNWSDKRLWGIIRILGTEPEGSGEQAARLTSETSLVLPTHTLWEEFVSNCCPASPSRNSKRSVCFCLQSSRAKGERCHLHLSSWNFKPSKTWEIMDDSRNLRWGK